MTACPITHKNISTSFKEEEFITTPSDEYLIYYKNQRKLYEKEILDLLQKEAILLIKKDMHETAIEICQKSLAIEPKDPFAWNNLGIALSRSKQFKESIIAYQNALHLNPAHDFTLRIYINMSYSILCLGQFNRGFKVYESRLKYWKTIPLVPNKRTSKQWEGENISGKTLLIHHDGGLGDSIHFSRYIPLLKAYNCKILLFLQPELNCLFEHLNAHLIKNGNSFQEYDAHVFTMSLPYCFNTQISTIPDPIKIECHYRPIKGRIGIAWKSRENDRNNLSWKKNLELKQMANLFTIPGVHYVSVQKEVSPEESVLLSKYHIERPQINSFTDTVKILETCEHVISVDTSVMHLAASMNIPTSLLLPCIACWRWLCGRQDSPWYPSVTLFRQKKIGVWNDPIEEIEKFMRNLYA
jgi:tetratricopeptide (TPR) repeat protein